LRQPGLDAQVDVQLAHVRGDRRGPVRQGLFEPHTVEQPAPREFSVELQLFRESKVVQQHGLKMLFHVALGAARADLGRLGW
jgi:hypothetical protein